MMNLFEVTMEIARWITRIFLKDEKGRRPVYDDAEKILERFALARLCPLL